MSDYIIRNEYALAEKVIAENDGYNPDLKLTEPTLNFLKENIGIESLDELSDEDYIDLFEISADRAYELAEDDSEGALALFGYICCELAEFMANELFTDGGSRYKG